MSDRVFPSTKPVSNGGTGNTTAATTTTTAPAPNPPPASNKSHLYNPTSRPPYRPQPRRRHSRSGRSIFCCCCFWTLLLLLLLILIAAIAGAALYILYRPHRPAFSIPSLRIHRLNLTTSPDSASSHISALLNLTVNSKNPNSHLTFFYDAFTISSFSSDGHVFLANGSVPAYSLTKKNETSFRNVVVSGSNDLDAESVNSLRSDLKKKNDGLSLQIQLDTKVKVKMGGLKTKKLGIRVTCDGIKGVLPKGKSPTVAVTSSSKCKVDLRIKIWKWTF